MEMGSSFEGLKKAHAVCIPHPAQGHINPMMMLAKLLHSRGVHVTFVLTDHIRARILRSRGPNALAGHPSFRFTSFPDGLPPSDVEVPQDVSALCDSLERNCVGPFTDLIRGLEGPPVSCIVADVAMTFTLEAAAVLGIREVMFWTASACGLLGYDQFPRLLDQGYTPLKDASYITNGHLDTPIEWIPAMKGIRLKDMPSFIRTTDRNDILFHFTKSMVERCREASAIIFNTYDALEHEVLASLAPTFPPFYLLGPMHIQVDRIRDDDEEIKSIGSNLWKEDKQCIQWLDSQERDSVVLVSFGSMTVMTNEQLVEFAFGLANSRKPFIWVIRPDLIMGESAVLPPEFAEETEGRSIMADWCDQVRVLSHPSVGGFLTHSGWNSTMESICAGVPMISWPFFAEQQTNCWSLGNVWGIGMEVESDVKREGVERQVRELMDGEKGKEMRRKAMEWKMLAESAIGDSSKDLHKLVDQVVISTN